MVDREVIARIMCTYTKYFDGIPSCIRTAMSYVSAFENSFHWRHFEHSAFKQTKKNNINKWDLFWLDKNQV